MTIDLDILCVSYDNAYITRSYRLVESVAN